MVLNHFESREQFWIPFWDSYPIFKMMLLDIFVENRQPRSVSVTKMTQFNFLQRWCKHKGSCQKRFSGFCPLRGYPYLFTTDEPYHLGSTKITRVPTLYKIVVKVSIYNFSYMKNSIKMGPPFIFTTAYVPKKMRKIGLKIGQNRA